ncbi:MAG: hypothetical protein HC831_29575 [Chloroflexia bacterium]|nr:hypothetical protein [Chloroflexia bacterium]
MVWILSIMLVGMLHVQAQQNIYVNQVGYLTNAPKYFYTDYEADSFAVINTKTRLAVLNGKMQLRKKKDPLAGFDIYSGSFSQITSKGEYVIKVFSPLNSGIVSYPFKVSDDVFSDLLLLANRSIFMQGVVWQWTKNMLENITETFAIPKGTLSFHE